MEKPKPKRNNILILFITISLIYILTFFLNPNYASTSFRDFLKVLKEIIPIIIFVYIFMFLINMFLDTKKINKHLGKDSGIKGWIYAIVSGIIIPSPPYIIFPILGEMRKKGMKDSLIVSFLYNRNLQIAFLPIMAYYFGILFTAIISVYIFIFAIISGIVIEKILK